MTSLWRTLFTDYLITSQTCHAKLQNSNQQALTLPASFLLVDAYRKQLGLKDFSPKVRTLWHCSRLREQKGALPMIDRGDIRQAIDRCSNIWASLPGALVMVSSSIRLDSLIAKFSEAGGTVREIDV